MKKLRPSLKTGSFDDLLESCAQVTVTPSVWQLVLRENLVRFIVADPKC